MWRAYTREKPARQGLALIIVALSSAMVAGFAGAVVNYKATPTLATENRAPSDWPITFQLPSDFEETSAVRAKQLDAGLESYPRRIIFKNHADARKRIGIGHRKAAEGNELVDAFMAMTERTVSDASEKVESVELPVSDREWRIIRKARGDTMTYMATLPLADRSIVRIAYITPSPGTKDRRILAAVCNSVAARDGFVERED